MVSILFCSVDSEYKKLPVICYDINRDARTFPGDTPVVAHPPCRSWGRLRHFSKATKEEHDLGTWAIAQVRQCGGVLEHPSGSSLFKETGCHQDGSLDQYGGYLISVNQSWWGFPAQKKTLLYIVGVPRSKLPPMPISFDAIQYRVGGYSTYRASRLTTKELPHKLNAHTTISFAKWLVQVAKLANNNKLSINVNDDSTKKQPR